MHQCVPCTDSCLPHPSAFLRPLVVSQPSQARAFASPPERVLFRLELRLQNYPSSWRSNFSTSFLCSSVPRTPPGCASTLVVVPRKPSGPVSSSLAASMAPLAAWDFLALTALVTAIYQLSFFIVAAGLKIDKVTDFAGTTNFILLAALTLALRGTYEPRQVLLSSMVILWGCRLALFLLIRILIWGEDRRFDNTRNDLLKFAGFWVFQALWVWTVSLPVTIVNQMPHPAPLGPGAWVGLGMWVLGLVVETVADFQKLQHKNAAPGEGGRAGWCYVGLWTWSRHPNYFGEIFLWLGVFVSSTAALQGWEWVAVLSPLFTASILLFLSGVPILEASSDKKYGARSDYRDFKASTSVLVPVPPSLYKLLPTWFKTWVLLDLPMYNTFETLSASLVPSELSSSSPAGS